VPKGFAASRLGKGLARCNRCRAHGATARRLPARKTQAQAGAVAGRDGSLKTLLRLKAEEAKVAPRSSQRPDDIESLAAHEDEGIAALHGWRAEVFGNDAVALRKGELALALEKGHAVVVELDDERG
jgi:ribonuclease D